MKRLLESIKNQGFLPLFILSFLLVLTIIASVLIELKAEGEYGLLLF
ncbi:hypothetical protein KKD61_04470 [Patescibacteria group bacterium]|nr:hypothetical protein [Patescibacteria group bacterium]